MARPKSPQKMRDQGRNVLRARSGGNRPGIHLDGSRGRWRNITVIHHVHQITVVAAPAGHPLGGSSAAQTLELLFLQYA